MRNHQVTNVQPLLNEDGSLREPGWSTQLVQIYDRAKIKKRKYHKKKHHKKKPYGKSSAANSRGMTAMDMTA